MFVSLFQIRRQYLFDPFHECADPTRQIAPMGDDEGHGERPAAKIRYDLHKRSTLQVSANPQEWRLNQAKAGEGSRFVGLRAVDVERTRQLKRRVKDLSKSAIGLIAVNATPPDVDLVAESRINPAS